MGCWNKTCGLTRLPIFSGEDTFVFLIQRNEPGESRCYSTALYSPLLLPFRAKYNDYGAGEEESGFVKYIMDGVAKNLVEMERGKNEYHDIPVKKDGFNSTNFFEAVHEDRLFVTKYGGEPQQLEFVMMRVDSVKHVLNNWKMEEYVGDGKGNRPEDISKYANNYLYYTFQDVIDGVPAFVDKVIKKFKDTKSKDDKIMLSMFGFERMFDFDDRSDLVANSMRTLDQSGYRFCTVVRPAQEIMRLCSIGAREGAIGMICDVLVGVFINTFMDSTRLIWAPGCHEGSQDDAGQEYEVLAGAIMAGVQSRKEMFGEDE